MNNCAFTNDNSLLPIGTKQGCLTIIAGFEAYQEECAKDRIAKLEDDKHKFINGENNPNHNFEDIETFDRWIDKEKNQQLYKVQCKCGKHHYMTAERFLKKRWRNCGDECNIKKQQESNKIASYSRVKSPSYDIEFINNTHESLSIVEWIDVEGKPIVYDRRRRSSGTIYLYKQYHCKCYLCGKEYDFLSNQFEIKNDSYGSKAKWGYYCEACCDCHNISSFQWRTIHILHEHKIPYRVEASFPDLLSEKGKPLRFDFLIYNSDNSIKCLLECQGKQHFEIGNGFGGYSALHKRQARDEQKRKYAEEHNIPLVEVTYMYDTYDKEVDFLKRAGVI